MSPSWVVKNLDVGKHTSPCIVMVFIDFASDFLLLEIREDAFRYRVVPTVPSPTHARLDSLLKNNAMTMIRFPIKLK